MTRALSWPEPANFVTTARARAVRTGINLERADAVRAGETPEPVDSAIALSTGRMFACSKGRPLTAGDVAAVHEFAALVAARGAAARDSGEGGTATAGAAGTPSPDAARQGRPGGRPCRVCGATPARPFMVGPLCAVHAPVVPIPDPATTAAGYRARFGLA